MAINVTPGKLSPWTPRDLFSRDITKRLGLGGDVGSSVGRGWLPLVERLNEDLAVVDPNYTIGQIKSKFGGLRYYAQLSSELRYDEKTWAQFRGLISAAEELSYRVCEECGRPGENRKVAGWYATECWYHYNRRRLRHWW